MTRKRIWNLIVRIKKDISVCIFLLFFAPLFLYNLGGFSLDDFDEAWYGEIARNILISHNPLLLTFNGNTYTDHPPFGFNLIAFSILVFGPTELAVRLPSAILGLMSIICIYFIGKNLFDRTVGIASSLILVSSVWFIFRARSGNLDSILVFLFLLSFYLAIKLKQNSNFIFLLSISFAALLLTKTLIGFLLVMPILSLVVIKKIKIPRSKLILALVLFLAIFLPWFLLNYFQFGWGFVIHQINLGLRTGNSQNINFKEILNSQTFAYLHFGIRKWYYPALAAIVISLFFSFKNKKLIPILLWVFILLYGFMHNAKTEIWHILPMYPPLALLIAYTVTTVTAYFLRKLNVYFKFKKSYLNRISSALTLLFFLLISLFQINGFKNEVRLTDKNKSGLSVVSIAARDRNETLFLDSDLTVPAVTAFYSQKRVRMFRKNPAPYNSLKTHIELSPKPFLLITEKWKLKVDGIPERSYKVLKENQGFLLIIVENQQKDI